MNTHTDILAPGSNLYLTACTLLVGDILALTLVGTESVLLRTCSTASSPEALQEWSSRHKLTHDPRIFPLGKQFWVTSLDELPQICNMLKGDLRLVGPRPIIWEEVEQYKAGFDAYKRVKPGLTRL